MPTLTLPSCSERLAALLGTGAARAQALGRPVLVSVVEPAPALDPLAALRQWESRCGADAGHRMYWARPRAGIAIACLGEVATVDTGGGDRFEALHRTTAELLDHAVVEPAGNIAEGTGPILAGGLAFEPDGAGSGAWSDFPAARFAVPRVQVTLADGRTWITASLLVDADGAPDMEPSAIGRLCAELYVPTGDGPDAADAPRGVFAQFADDMSQSAWQQLVTDAVDAIAAGAFAKVVLARTRRCLAGTGIDVHGLLARLAAGYPDCFVFGIWSGTSAFVGASPERLVRLEGRDVQASSLAGSAPRGDTPTADRAFADALASSAKDLAEHAVVRETLVASLQHLCEQVQSDDVPSLFTLPHVHHLHTTVDARLRAGRTVVDLVEALHPTPAVGGAPRGAALAWIRANEGLDRGWYAAPVGWIGRGRGEFAVALRSALVSGDQALLFAGCGIVARSDPSTEYAETLLKLRPMEQAIAQVAGGAG